MQVGVWAQHREFRKKFYRHVSWGRRNIFCEKIISVPLLCSYPLHMYGAYLINEYHQDFKSIANFKVLKRMINVMMCYCVLF